MSINFPCPKCGHVLAAPERLAGRKAKCRCGEVVIVPAIELQGPAMGKPEAKRAASAKVTASPPVLDETVEEQSAVQAKLSELAEAFDGIRPNLWRAVRLMAVCTVTIILVFWGSLYGLRQVFAGVMETDSGLANCDRFLPFFAILSALFGLGFGSGRLLTERSGLFGWPACGVGTAGVLLLMASGLLVGKLVFPGESPSVEHVCLFAAGFMSMIGISFYTLWVS